MEPADRENPAVMRKIFIALGFAGVLLTAGAVLLGIMTLRRKEMQYQNDPAVAASWIVGARKGGNPSLFAPTLWQKYLNKTGLKFLYSPPAVQSRYSGTNGSLELWLGYQSHLKGHPLLVCHRVGRTAFVDDMGQDYHGFLDVHGHIIGIFLPGYDHAAHRLTCILHWMPQEADENSRVSLPMLYTISLTPPKRKLPSAAQLSQSAVQTEDGMTVHVWDVRLSNLQYGGYLQGQRTLSFSLHVMGGELAGSNMIAETAAKAPAGAYSSQVTDPYGIVMNLPHTFFTPMFSLTSPGVVHEGDGTVWTVPVDSAGKSTDACTFHLPMQPTAGGAPVWFSLTVRVRQNEDV